MLALGTAAVSAYSPGAAATLSGTGSFGSTPRLMMSTSGDLRTFLSTKAGVAPKFLDVVESICDDEMIGDVASMKIAAEAGLLKELFKPVVALGIEKGAHTHALCRSL